MRALKRELGLFEAVVYGTGIILGAGIYTLVGEGARITGNSLWLSFVIGAVVAGFTGLSYAELATMFPKAAAEYVYVQKGFGMKILSFLIGWLILLTGVTTASAVALGFAGYLNGLSGVPPLVSAGALIVLLSFVNFVGIKQSSYANTLFTLIEVAGLVLIIILALGNWKGITAVNFLDMPGEATGVLSASALVFFAYLGFEDIANVAEETRNPTRTMPRAFILAILTTTLLYVLTSVAVVSLASPAELGASKSPLALAASHTFLGRKAFTVMSIIALFATANTVLVAILVGSRMMYGMARDRSLPVILSRLDKQNGTPYVAILAMTVFSIAFLLIRNIGFIAGMSSLWAFLTFALVNASLIVLRFKSPRLQRPFKSPLNIGRFPVLAALGLASSVFMVFQFEWRVIQYTFIFILAGLTAYWVLENSRARQRRH